LTYKAHAVRWNLAIDTVNIIHTQWHWTENGDSTICGFKIQKGKEQIAKADKVNCIMCSAKLRRIGLIDV